MSSLSKDPAFLFYYQDFLVGTDHMTNEQVGMYIKALCHQANRGSIRPEHLRNICVTRDNHMIIIEKFKELPSGEFCNMRLLAESEKRKNYSESRRNNRKGSNKSNTCKSYVPHMENENISEDGNGNVDNNTNKRFKPPTLKEVKAYCIERRNQVDPVAFFNFYEANGWKQGSKPIKKWKACVITWERKTSSGDSVTVDNTPRGKAMPDCMICHGRGLNYAPGSGKELPCKCTEVKV